MLSNKSSLKIKCTLKMYIFPILLLLILFLPMFVYADTPQAGSALSMARGSVKDIISLISNIFNPLAVLCLGIALIRIVVSKNSKDTEEAIKWAKRIIIAFVIFNIAGTFIAWTLNIKNMQHTYNYGNPGSVGDVLKDISDKEITEYSYGN